MCSAYGFIVGAIGTRGLPEIQIVCPFGKLQYQEFNTTSSMFC